MKEKSYSTIRERILKGRIVLNDETDRIQQKNILRPVYNLKSSQKALFRVYRVF